jgi:hypothetical protein
VARVKNSFVTAQPLLLQLLVLVTVCVYAQVQELLVRVAEAQDVLVAVVVKDEKEGRALTAAGCVL